MVYIHGSDVNLLFQQNPDNQIGAPSGYLETLIDTFE